MDRSSVIYLMTETVTQDQYGINQITLTEKKAYCQVTSVSASEWFDGGRNGLNPEYRMTMFKYDYSGENIVKYNDVLYTVYRTYETRDDFIELYVERREGNIEVPEPDPEPTPDPVPEPDGEDG